MCHMKKETVELKNASDLAVIRMIQMAPALVAHKAERNQPGEE